MFKAFLWEHLKYIGFQTFLYVTVQLQTIFAYCRVFPEHWMMNSCWSNSKAELGWTFIKAIKVILFRMKVNVYSVPPAKLTHRIVSY